MKNFLPGFSNISIFIRNITKLYFEETYIYKSWLNWTSAEYYLIGKNYKLIDENIKKLILNNYKNINNINIENLNFTCDIREIEFLIKNNIEWIEKY